MVEIKTLLSYYQFVKAPVLLMDLALFCLACSPDGVAPVLTVGGGSVTAGKNSAINDTNH